MCMLRSHLLAVAILNKGFEDNIQLLHYSNMHMYMQTRDKGIFDTFFLLYYAQYLYAYATMMKRSNAQQLSR